jgi:MFS transporter, DHA3 family, tetracycline resistance protein
MRSGDRVVAKSSAVIAEGLRYCRSQPWLWWSILGAGLGNLACFVPVTILEALLVQKVFHTGGIDLGLMYASSGAGGLVASVAAGQRTPRRRVTAIWAAWAGAGATAVLLGLSPWLWADLVLAGVLWFGVTHGNVLWFPLMQQEVPRDLLGRASSADWMVSLALTPLGAMLGGALAQAIGTRLTLVAGGLAAVAAGAVLLIPGVTALDRRIDQPAEQA